MWTKVQLGENMNQILKHPYQPQTTTCSKMFTAYLNKYGLLHQIKLAHSINYFDDWICFLSNFQNDVSLNNHRPHPTWIEG